MRTSLREKAMMPIAGEGLDQRPAAANMMIAPSRRIVIEAGRTDRPPESTTPLPPRREESARLLTRSAESRQAAAQVCTSAGSGAKSRTANPAQRPSLTTPSHLESPSWVSP
jgi:hypothetical protein